MNTDGTLRLHFVRHPWPYPSAVSLLSNLARVHVLGRQDLAALWLSSPHAKRLADELAGMRRLVTDDCIAASLRLTAAEVSLAFDPTQWWPEALRTFAPAFVDPLRFCPACLEEGYHSNLFQLPWWARCPMHDVSLRSACPHCGGPLTGLSLRAAPARALHCSDCNRSLVSTGALVDAARGPNADRWHLVVAAHRRWAVATSQAFVIAPALTTPYCELAPEHTLEWIHAAGVDWPAEIEPFVTRSSAAPLGLKTQLKVSGRGELRVLDQLASRVVEPPDANVSTARLVSTCSPPAAQALIRLENQLQRASDVQHLRSRKQGDRDRQRSGEKGIRNTSKVEFDLIAGIRDRGFRRRRAAMDVARAGGGLACLSMRPSDLMELSAVRLMRHVDSWLRTAPEMDELHPIGIIVRWWHAHLMALSVVDGTIASIQAMAWSPTGCDDQLLPGWPAIYLNRHAPGHAWLLGATWQAGHLTAYLGSVPLARTIRPDTARVRALQEMLGLEMLVFQTLGRKWANERTR